MGIFIDFRIEPSHCVLKLNLGGSEKQFSELTESEYRKLFEEYFAAIRNYIYFKTSDRDLAEDIAQDTFVKLWENRARIDKRTVKSFLYTISGNLAINQLKRQQLQYKFVNQLSDQSSHESPAFQLEMKEYESKLQGVIASMPNGSREVFLMNRIEDMKYKEIAERLGISVKAVEKRMSKALQIIREKLNVKL